MRSRTRAALVVLLSLGVAPPLAAQRCFRVRDIGPGAAGNAQRYFACLGELLLFDASDGVHGVEPWRSDGTEAGTFQLADVHPVRSSVPELGIAFGGQMYFVAFDAAHGDELWRSDGTVLGTRLFVDLQNGFASGPYDLTVVGSELYFAAWGTGSGYELWKSDGTAAGTTLVADIYAGATSSVPDHLADVAGTLFLSARDDVTGERNLWRSDGTAAGTTLVREFPGAGSPQDLIAMGSTLLFTAQTPALGRELWRSDGTTAGTFLVRDIHPGNSGSHPSELVVLDGILYFTAYEPSSGRELWRSDGTGAGTYRVTDVHPGPASAEPNNLVAVGHELFFAAIDPAGGQELWASDGTELGTRRVRDVAPGGASGLGAGSFFSYLTPGWGLLHFAADEGVGGTEPWRSDGREGGTLRIQDVQPGPGGSMAHLAPYGMAACGPWLFFLADDGLSGLELWATDWIFGDGFESGDLSAWSAVAGPAGSVVVTAASALEGTMGLEVSLGSGQGPRYVQDDSPDGWGRYRASFLLDADDLVAGGGAVLPGGARATDARRRLGVLAGLDDGLGVVAAVDLVLDAGGVSLVARARDDGGSFAETAPIPLAPGSHAIEIDRQRATADGAGDGRLELFVDGVPAGAVEGLDDDALGVDLVRLGAMTGWPGAVGVLRLDGFESRRVLPVGF